MPSEKSARVAHRRFLRNRAVRSALRTLRTKADHSLQVGNAGDAAKAVTEVTSALDRAAQKGVIHPNKAARLKSRLARKFNAAQQATQAGASEPQA